MSSLKKSKKLAIDTDIIPFLSSIILSKIKIKHGNDQIGTFTKTHIANINLGSSGRSRRTGKFDLLPRINEELEANINQSKDHSLKRINSSEAFDTADEIHTEDYGLLHTSTQRFSNIKFGLDIDVDEANKHFNREAKDESDQMLMTDNVEEDYSLNLKGKEIASKFQRDIMFDRSIMKQTKEVPPGPKSRSVPRNQDFFNKTNKEDVKGPPGVKANKGGFNFMQTESKESEDHQSEEEKDSNNIVMSESGAPTSKEKIKGVIKKRFAFLNTEEDKEEEKEQHEEVIIQKKNKLVLNPAATGATEFQSDSSSERSEVLNFKGKPQFKKPIINTEAINEMFTYGGEKGDLLIRLDDDEEENAAFLKELNEIASMCVAAMNRSSPDEDIIHETEDSGNQEEIDYTLKEKKKNKDFMTPQTLRGYTKIKFTNYNEVDDNKPVKSYMQQENNVIQEEPSPPATSKSSSSKHDLNTPKSNFTLDTPKTLLEKAAVEEYNAGIESLYVSILEWMLSRSPSNLNEPLMIDDSDEINNPNVLIILFNLIKYSTDLLKQKALQDFQMLAKLNKQNCYHFLESKFFHPWILNLLLPYQISVA